MRKQRFIILLFIAIFAAAAYVLGWSNVLTVSKVEITGTSKFISSSIIPGQKLARIAPRVVANSYEKLAWVRSARVSRNWLSGKVTITITERVPIAIYNDLAIDKEGVSFPLSGPSIDNLVHIQASTVESAIVAANFYSTLPGEFASEISILIIRVDDSLVMQMHHGKNSVEVFWGQSGENDLKARVYSALMQRPENIAIKRIDLSAPHAPIVK